MSPVCAAIFAFVFLAACVIGITCIFRPEIERWRDEIMDGNRDYGENEEHEQE